jgi:hypothetical protein
MSHFSANRSSRPNCGKPFARFSIALGKGRERAVRL